MPRTVVIGCSDSTGEDALALGHQIARALDARAVVATVVHHPRGQSTDPELDAAVAEFCAPLFEQARERMQDVKVVERPIVARSRSRAMFELAEEEEPAAIVIGSTRRGPVGRVLLGTLGNSLLSGAPCAVAVAPGGYADRDRHIERVGVAVDDSSESLRAVGAAAELAPSPDPPIRLLSVVDPPPYVLGGLLSGFDPEQYRERKRRDTGEVLRRAAERVPSGIASEGELLDGDPAEALAEAGEALDLLVMGSRGYGPITHTLLGGVSGKLMRTAPCPLMVVARGTGLHSLGH